MVVCGRGDGDDGDHHDDDHDIIRFFKLIIIKHIQGGGGGGGGQCRKSVRVVAGGWGSCRCWQKRFLEVRLLKPSRHRSCGIQVQEKLTQQARVIERCKNTLGARGLHNTYEFRFNSCLWVSLCGRVSVCCCGGVAVCLHAA